MSEYMMIMRSKESSTEWGPYIEKLVASGKFRGGSAFGNSACFSKSDNNAECIAVGFMRFEADSREEVEALLVGNPTWEADGFVEIHELVIT